MNPKQFLLFGGTILVVVAILGFVGVIGPTADQSIFKSAWWFDNAENWAHLILGVVGLLAAYVLPAAGQKTLVMLLGILGLVVAAYNLFSLKLLDANLERPLDTILHAGVGLWALFASMTKPKGSAMPSGPA